MKRVLLPVAVALMLVALIVGTVGAQTFYTILDDVWAKSLITSGNTTVGGNLAVVGTTSFAGATALASVNTTGNIYSGNSLVTAGDVRVGGNTIVTGTFNATGNSSTNGTFSSTGNMATGGKMSVGTFIVPANQGNLTITEGLTFTPTGTFQGITAAGAVSTGQITVLPAGTIVKMINFGSNTITLTETANLVMSGNIALGQYDTIDLISDGTRWIQTGTTNN